MVVAESRCTGSIGYSEEKVQAYITDALESRAKGRFSEAVSDLTAGLKLPVDRQTKAELLQVRGGVLMCQHRYDQAVRDFSGEIGLSPEDITGWYNRGLALVYSKQYDAGRVDLVRFGMAIGPSYARAKEGSYFEGPGLASLPEFDFERHDQGRARRPNHVPSGYGVC